MKNSFSKIFIPIILYCFLQFYQINSASNKKISNCLLLIAHPDDESMFFSPFLHYNKPFILCLSDGNFEGKGHIRREELSALCKKRGIEFRILDYSDNSNWDIDQILFDLIKICFENKITRILTFDLKGISGHKNHISCFKAVKKLEEMDKNKTIKIGYLKTVNLFEKYFLFLRRPDYSLTFSKFGLENMAFHKSQLVWFRYIYVLVSSYMRYNVIE